LKQSPEALSYLAKRGINDAEMIERFRIGFSDRTLGLRLPEKNRKAGGEIRARLAKARAPGANPATSILTARS
jgi:DNA primase